MKIAHLILAHKNPHQLKRLIAALDHKDFAFYIHIDRKVDQRPFESVLNKSVSHKSSIQFIEQRVDIRWGDWGTIEATINGFSEISKSSYDYINVISGQDFPVVAPGDISDYLETNKGREFITCHKPEGDWADAKTRISEYHLINTRFPGRHQVEKIITKILPKRKFPLPYELVGRANWFTLSQKAVQYCLGFLAANPRVVKYFRYCWGADEFIFSTILYNSAFRDDILDNLVYVDWNSGSKGHPKILGLDDYNAVINSGKLFARKFDLVRDDSLARILEEKMLFYK